MTERKKRARETDIHQTDITPTPPRKKAKVETKEKSLKNFAPRESWELIGHGLGGEIFLTTESESGETVAIKVARWFFDPKEISILEQLKSRCDPFILCYKYYFQDSESKESFLVTEYLQDYKTLNKVLEENEMTMKEKSILICNIYNAFKVLHEEGIRHSDIHGGNIMVNPKTWNVKIIDFGRAKKYEPSQEALENKQIAWIIVRILNVDDKQEGQLGNYNYFTAVIEAIEYKEVDFDRIIPKNTPKDIEILVKDLLFREKTKVVLFPKFACKNLESRE